MIRGGRADLGELIWLAPGTDATGQFLPYADRAVRISLDGSGAETIYDAKLEAIDLPSPFIGSIPDCGDGCGTVPPEMGTWTSPD